MLAHSRGGGGEPRMADLNAIVEETLDLAVHGARAQDPNFNLILASLRQGDGADRAGAARNRAGCFLNLFGNAFYAVDRRKREARDPSFEPKLKATTRDLGDAVEVLVWDNGVGIPPEIREKLFQPVLHHQADRRRRRTWPVNQL